MQIALDSAGEVTISGDGALIMQFARCVAEYGIDELYKQVIRVYSDPERDRLVRQSLNKNIADICTAYQLPPESASHVRTLVLDCIALEIISQYKTAFHRDRAIELLASYGTLSADYRVFLPSAGFNSP
jgi:hypothetical protein